MGARSSSPRSVHLDNESPVNVIDVSEEVVDRLKGLHNKEVARQNEHDRKVAAAAVAAARLEWERQSQQNKSTQQPTNTAPAATAPPTIIYTGASTMTALEVRRQKEEELRNNDKYWQGRLTKQEEDLKKTAAILEKEYKETLEQVRQRFETSAPQYQLPPCKDFKAKIIDCYKANPKQTLNCSNIVDDFSNCVQEHRTKLLNEKYSSAKQPVAAAS